MYADVVIRSNHIFSKGTVCSGFVAIKDGRIIEVGNKEYKNLVGPKTSVIECGDHWVTPGLIDVHCFFSGDLLIHAGEDLGECRSVEKLRSDLLAASPVAGIYIGYNVGNDLFDGIPESFFENFKSPVILRRCDGEKVHLNKAAGKLLGWDGKDLSSEAQWKLIDLLLRDEELSVSAFEKYQKRMNRHGVTAVKEMGFDTYSGFTEVLHRLDAENRLSLRVNFMSQPVAERQNLSFGRDERRRNTDWVRFSGYNHMSDGSVSEYCADLKNPYENGWSCRQTIDYEGLKEDTIAADSEGFRTSLHAQGDAAIHKCMEIFAKCCRNEQGRLYRRHSMTDLELSDPVDFAEIAKLGIVGEIYPQIMSIYDDPAAKIRLTNEHVGTNRAGNYWNRRGMLDTGITLSCATDLPLSEDNLGQSIKNSVYGRFGDGTLFQEQNTMTIKELLTAWTWGGAYNLGLESFLGELRPGFAADLVVWNYDLSVVRWEETDKIAAEYCFSDGKEILWPEGGAKTHR